MADSVISLTIPANTPERAPIELVMPVYVGWCESVAVLFPSGCAQLARVAIFDRDSKIAPAPSSHVAWLTGDGQPPVMVPVRRRLSGPPYVIKVRGWNEDDTYPHTPTIMVEMGLG